MVDAVKKRVILGIDPGTNAMGYGVLVVEGKALEVACLGTVQLNKFSNAYEKLSNIYKKTAYLIEQYLATEFAVEAPFYGKNPQSMLKLGRAQGVAIAAAVNAHLEVKEYSPKKVKQSITGNGNASKEQVAAMVQNILKFTETPKFLDATDALSVALCHYYQSSNPVVAGGVKDWKAFIKANPERVNG